MSTYFLVYTSLNFIFHLLSVYIKHMGTIYDFGNIAAA